MLGTKEFYDLMDAFEKVAKNEIRTGSSGLKREPIENWEKGCTILMALQMKLLKFSCTATLLAN